jgi:hypothetical protein
MEKAVPAPIAVPARSTRFMSFDDDCIVVSGKIACG